jgi:hypothetical protein
MFVSTYLIITFSTFGFQWKQLFSSLNNCNEAIMLLNFPYFASIFIILGKKQLKWNPTWSNYNHEITVCVSRASRLVNYVNKYQILKRYNSESIKHAFHSTLNSKQNLWSPALKIGFLYTFDRNFHFDSLSARNRKRFVIVFFLLLLASSRGGPYLYIRLNSLSNSTLFTTEIYNRSISVLSLACSLNVAYPANVAYSCCTSSWHS